MHIDGGAIFDMDGLLIDSEPLWMATETEQLEARYGIRIHRSELLAWQGRSTREFCAGMADAYPERAIDPDELLAALFEQMSQRIVEAALMPGAREILDWMVSHRVPLAIASSSPLPFIEAVVERHRLPVDLLVSGTEVPRSKPDPAIFELTARRLGILPARCLVWEDSVNGVKAARAAKMRVVAIPDPANRSADAFALADRIYGSLHESLADLAID